MRPALTRCAAAAPSRLHRLQRGDCWPRRRPRSAKSCRPNVPAGTVRRGMVSGSICRRVLRAAGRSGWGLGTTAVARPAAPAAPGAIARRRLGLAAPELGRRAALCAALVRTLRAAMCTRSARVSRVSRDSWPSATSTPRWTASRTSCWTSTAARGSGQRSRSSSRTRDVQRRRATPWCLIVSDGLERGDPGAMATAVERLARLAHRVVWWSPLARATRNYQPLTRGMAAVVGDLDDLVGVCDLASAVDAVRRLSAVEAGPRRSVPATRSTVDTK